MSIKVISATVISVLLLASVTYVVVKGNDVTRTESANTRTDEQTNASTPNEAQPNTPQTAGSYITYSDYTANKATYDSGTIVYFFNAQWCPTCQALVKDINANISTIPAGTAIVSVDYDQYTDLKKQYGVTYQHTLVQVNKDGAQIKKWSGSPTLSALLGRI